MRDDIPLTRRIEEDRITLECEETGPRPDLDWPHRNYRLVFHRPGAAPMEVVDGVQHGIGVEEEPRVAETLANVLTGAVDVENSTDYAEWASGFATDPADWMPLSTYDALCEMRNRLEVFLGEKYEAYLWETDHCA